MLALQDFLEKKERKKERKEIKMSITLIKNQKKTKRKRKNEPNAGDHLEIDGALDIVVSGRVTGHSHSGGLGSGGIDILPLVELVQVGGREAVRTCAVDRLLVVGVGAPLVRRHAHPLLLRIGPSVGQVGRLPGASGRGQVRHAVASIEAANIGWRLLFSGQINHNLNHG